MDDFEWCPGTAVPQASKGLAKALLEPGPDPVIWPDEAGFADAIAGLWHNLWPAIRTNFSFRLAFSPQDVAANPPAIVSTPSALLSRWSGYRIASRDSAQTSDAISFLAGDPLAMPLRELMNELSAQLPLISDLRHLSEVHRILTEESALDDLMGGLRAIAYLSPDPSSGQTIKRDITLKAASALATAEPDKILMTRNLDLGAFTTARSFWEAVQTWASEGLWNNSNSAASAHILHEACNATSAVEAWRSAITIGTDKSISSPTDQICDGVWRILIAKPALLPTLVGRTKAPSLQARLVVQAPKSIDENTARSLMASALAANRPHLHAAVAAAAFPAAKAVEIHIAEAPIDDASLEIILRRASPKERVKIALIHDEHALFRIAGEAAASLSYS